MLIKYSKHFDQYPHDAQYECQVYGNQPKIIKRTFLPCLLHHHLFILVNIFREEKPQKNDIDLDVPSAEFTDNDHGHNNIENHSGQCQIQE